ncbi:hypothetical protein KC955_01285 [Candidatus Saccharibacteria bacterium]|nr:hypothetical protein [Candidatus Saccharibacteria bacterium]MCA9834135.1 hypothetical protein [Thermomicrobiales bacterium]
MNTLATKIAGFILAIAVALGVGGTVLYQSAHSLAQGDAKSLCTNLNLLRFDRSHGASYASDTLIVGYEQDLLELGYLCGADGAKKVDVIDVSDKMHPSVIKPTCEADGALVLPEVKHATWQKQANDKWELIDTKAGPGEYRVRLNPDKGYALSTPIETKLTVKQKLDAQSSECKVSAAPTPSAYECRTAGLNGNPQFIALQAGKLGQYAYGKPFTGTTVADARQHIHDQSWCDPVWMLQKYREYVDPWMSAEQADAKAHELITQAKAGEQAQWDNMVSQIMDSFDNRSTHVYTTLKPGKYHSLGTVTNTEDGIPRIVDFIVSDSTWAPIFQSTVTYADGTTAVLNLRTLCDLQLRTSIKINVTGPATAPPMAELPRNEEGTITRVTTPETSTTVTPEPTPTPTPTPTPEACPPMKDGSTPPRLPDGSCLKDVAAGSGSNGNAGNGGGQNQDPGPGEVTDPEHAPDIPRENPSPPSQETSTTPDPSADPAPEPEVGAPDSSAPAEGTGCPPGITSC